MNHKEPILAFLTARLIEDEAEATEFWEAVGWATPRVAAAWDHLLDSLFGPEEATA